MLTHNQLNWGLLIVGTLTAGGTIGLAAATFWMAKKTRDLAVQEERHHQDGAMPICLLAEAVGSRGNTVEFVERSEGGQPVFEYQVYGPLRNIGQGPALNLRLVLRFPTFNNHEVIYDLDPLGAGDVKGLASAFVVGPDMGTDFQRKQFVAHEENRIAVIPIAPAPGFNDTTIKMSQEAWGNIFLEYTDIFGNQFYTQHTKSPQQQWIQFNKGIRPSAIAPPAIPSKNRSAFSTPGFG